MPIRKVASAIQSRVSANIYIVDHNIEFASSLIKSIEKPEKYSIEAFGSGESFIAFLKNLGFLKNEVTMVFLGYKFISDSEDSQLMNGLEILEAIKAINPQIEVVMLYGSDEGSFGSYARKAGAFDFIQKNNNAFLRVNNIIWRVITAKRLEQKRRLYGIILAIAILIAYLMLTKA
jgi:DNA-binding NtrC family response regulator